MRNHALIAMLAGAAGVSGCATQPAPLPMAAATVCAPGWVDANNDGVVSESEWNIFRAANYVAWDIDRDERLERAEFENCYRAGGFLPGTAFHPDYWTYYWDAFDANNDGWLTGDEYWSAAAWARIDDNRNGQIDANEWIWWG